MQLDVLTLTPEAINDTLACFSNTRTTSPRSRQRGAAPPQTVSRPSSRRRRRRDRAMAPPASAEGHLLANLMHSPRTLRAAGLPIGPGKVLAPSRRCAPSASRTAPISTGRSTPLRQPRDQREIFDQAFHIFWRNPQLLERCCRSSCRARRRRSARGRGDDPRLAASDASGSAERADETGEEKVEIDATMTFSERELLREMDFEKIVARRAGPRQIGDQAHAPAGDGGADAALPPRSWRGRGPICVRRFEPPCARAGLMPCAASAGARGRRRLSSSATFPARLNRYSRLFLHFMPPLQLR